MVLGNYWYNTSFNHDRYKTNLLPNHSKSITPNKSFTTPGNQSVVSDRPKSASPKKLLRKPKSRIKMRRNKSSKLKLKQKDITP